MFDQIYQIHSYTAVALRLQNNFDILTHLRLFMRESSSSIQVVCVHRQGWQILQEDSGLMAGESISLIPLRLTTNKGPKFRSNTEQPRIRGDYTMQLMGIGFVGSCLPFKMV